MPEKRRKQQRIPPENSKTQSPPSTSRNGLFTCLETGATSPHRTRGRYPRQRWNVLRQLPTNLRKNSSPVREFSVSTAARQGHPFRPLPLMQRVAGAKAIPDARRADGAPQQTRTSPRPQAGVMSAPMPHATCGGRGMARFKRQISRSRQRGVRGCRGCRGDFPLSPHAPRRAGDPPSAPGSSRDAQRGSGLIRPRALYLFQR